MQKELAEMRVEGSSGGGMVSLTVDGHKNLLALKLDPEVVNRDDVGMLQDLIVAAFNDASAKVDEQLTDKLGAMGAGLKVPGMFG
ncbi:MAG: YbaB/EbfC family nucleoid-associated protein [Acidobacteriota bacterium]|nr:YbaB/EbfC family nucleoid-associated protein [Acidobacteriota bacterium]